MNLATISPSAYGDDRRIVRYFMIVVAIFARWIAPYDAENYFVMTI